MQINKIVTHAIPHIDDIAAIWLLKKFYTEYQHAEVLFLERPASGIFEIDEDMVAVGIGKGQFDEHRDDAKEECAATLVWKWLQDHPEFNLSEVVISAISQIIERVSQEDHGELRGLPLYEWSVTIPVEQYWFVVNGDNQKVYEFGAALMEALFVYYQNLAELNKDWEKRIDFESRWGKAVAIESSAKNISDKAFAEGNVLVVWIDPSTGSRQYRARNVETGVDLTEVYEQLHQLEPDASWFLHPAKTLLLCGSKTAPNFVASKRSLKELIDQVV